MNLGLYASRKAWISALKVRAACPVGAGVVNTVGRRRRTATTPVLQVQQPTTRPVLANPTLRLSDGAAGTLSATIIAVAVGMFYWLVP
jgi:hypothetical protein